MITFDELTHTYTVNGSILPSVSEIVGRIMPGQYADVPEHVLKLAADFGTEVHKMIEIYNVHGLYLPAADDRKNKCLDEYIRLSGHIKPLENEWMGHYKHYFAGRLDCVGEIDGKKYIIEHKTTSVFHRERVELQCSLHRLMYGWDDIAGLKCMWLPKGKKGQLYDLTSWDRQELLKILIGVTVCTNAQKH